MPIDINVKKIYVLRPFQKALICPNWIMNTLVLEEKVYFSIGEVSVPYRTIGV
jgi:hypothetical protein